MVKTKSKKRSAGRGATFTVTELVNMYTLSRELLPVSGADWKNVADKHNQSWGNPERNPKSCRKKFDCDHKAKPPTSDPNCPPHIVLAKHTFRDITHKCEVEEGDESSSDSEGSGGDDNKGEEEEVQGVNDTLNDSLYEEEVAANLHDPPPTAEEIVDESMMDAFSPATAVLLNTMQSVEPPTLTPTIPLTIETGTLHTLVGEDTSRSLVGEIDASGQDQNIPASCTPVVPQPSRKIRGIQGPYYQGYFRLPRRKNMGIRPKVQEHIPFWRL